MKPDLEVAARSLGISPQWLGVIVGHIPFDTTDDRRWQTPEGEVPVAAIEAATEVPGARLTTDQRQCVDGFCRWWTATNPDAVADRIGQRYEVPSRLVQVLTIMSARTSWPTKTDDGWDVPADLGAIGQLRGPGEDSRGKLDRLVDMLAECQALVCAAMAQDYGQANPMDKDPWAPNPLMGPLLFDLSEKHPPFHAVIDALLDCEFAIVRKEVKRTAQRGGNVRAPTWVERAAVLMKGLGYSKQVFVALIQESWYLRGAGARWTAATMGN